MRVILFSAVLLWSWSLTGQNLPCDQVVTGRILDIVTKEPLPYATIKQVGTNKGAVSDEEGHFVINNICEDDVHLEVRFIGYKTMVHHHDMHHVDQAIYMAPDETQLESIVIENTITGEIQSISVQKKDIDKLSIVTSSIGSLTEEITGVSMLKTGANISKPMIHGLHSNRVLVVNDGIRHAYQVWGQEHAPEIDPSHVDQIEIVKGAGTVKYGPEALGGVILYNPKKPKFDQSLHGSVGTSYQTNGKAINSQVNLGQGSHKFAWNVGGLGIHQGDLHAPDYTLSNTGKREYGASFNTLLHQQIFDLQVSGSYLNQELGILRGSIVGNLEDLQNGIDRGTPSPTFPWTYDIQNPRQETDHGLLKSNLSLFLGEHVVDVRYAFQQNVRREYDVRRGELNDRPVIDLKLFSHNLEAEWVQPSQGRWNGNSGIQLYTQNSTNKPESNPVNFVPDYEVFNIGAFTIQSINFDNTTLELGARFDFQNLHAADTIREITIYSNDVKYANGTFTLGLRKKLNKTLSIYSNIGSAWRPPNVAELYSFGYHHSRIQFGLWRYELDPDISTPLNRVLDETDRPVRAEKSIKWVTGLEYENGPMRAEFIVYANQINDYIFLRPYGVTTNVAGTFPYFIYDQTSAFFAGTDWDIRYNHSKLLTSEVKVSYVHAKETTNNQPFVGIPPLNLNYGIDLRQGNWNFGLNFDYTAEQWNAPMVIEPIEFQDGNVEVDPNEIFDFMAPPDDYLLIGAKINYQNKGWNVAFSADNLLNTSYRIYVDRLRYFADSPGRNFSLAIGFKF